MALAQFEKYAGGAVFTRLGRGLRLNDRGRRLLPAAGAALEAYDRFLAACSDGGPLRGQVRIGASTTIANYCLPALLGQFAGKNPQVELILRVGNTEEMAGALRAGEIDFAVVEGEVSGQDLEATNWKRDELAVIVPRAHRLAGRHSVHLSELTRERWILREHGKYCQTGAIVSRIALLHYNKEGHSALKQARARCFQISCRRPPPRLEIGRDQTI